MLTKKKDVFSEKSPQLPSICRGNLKPEHSLRPVFRTIELIAGCSLFLLLLLLLSFLPLFQIICKSVRREICLCPSDLFLFFRLRAGSKASYDSIHYNSSALFFPLFEQKFSYPEAYFSCSLKLIIFREKDFVISVSIKCYIRTCQNCFHWDYQ